MASFRGYQIALGIDRDDLATQGRQVGHQGYQRRRWSIGSRVEMEDDICLSNPLEGQTPERALQQIGRLQEPGEVEKDELGSGLGPDSGDWKPGRLGLGGDHGKWGAEDGVEEG
jgi:hypothetical protein